MVKIEKSTFKGNEAGPLLSPTQTLPRAACLFIRGGYQVQITKSTFAKHEGLYSYQATYRAPTFGKYLPDNYYSYESAPLIRIYSIPKIVPTANLQYNVQVTSNTFQYNKFVQIIGFPESLQYKGGILEHEGIAGSSFFHAKPLLNLTDNTFYRN